MAHTPGPWDYDPDSKEVFSSNERHGCGWIALVTGNDSADQPLPAGMQAANARLIAAAPELLAALRFVLPVLERAACRGTIDAEGVNLELEAAREVQDAIAKAEGRSGA